MQTLENRTALVTGGNSGLGRGLVEILVERGADVTVLARDAGHLDEVRRELGVGVVQADITDRNAADEALKKLKPSIVVLSAGYRPKLAPIHEQTWDEFDAMWSTDVKAGLHWIQAAIGLPLARGSRVLILSSGAAVAGSPLSGGYAGAKRMLWLMAHYANDVSDRLDLGIRFQVLIPRQMIGATERGYEAAQAYGRRRGITPEAVLAGFGKAMSPREFGGHVATILTDPAYEKGTAFGLKGDTGITSLDDPAP
ncbi:MAG TPA: SDR family oxidoreductase [Rhodanobacteraceae bacterium]|nr:SDR family oxidoreductase [Rhodanobacteraceae bacterium]